MLKAPFVNNISIRWIMNAWITEKGDRNIYGSNSIRGELSLILLLSAFIASCTTPYQARGLSGVGYENSQIDTNTFQVTYYGDKGMDDAMVERYSIYRCAELAIEKGYDYFVITDQQSDKVVGTTINNQVSRNPVMGGMETSSKTTVNSSRAKYSATKMIKLFTGSKPAENGMAYNAREVLANLGPQIKR